LSVLNEPTGVWKEPGLNSYWLNPLFPSASGQDFDIISYGKTYQGVNHYRDNVGQSGIFKKFLGLRAPIILTGHGYDINGNYVPNNTDFLTRSDKWLTGVLDPLWNNNRKVWTVHDIYLGVVTQAITPRSGNAWGSGVMTWYKNMVDQKQPLTIYNQYATAIPTGIFITAGFVADDNKLVLMSSDCV